MTDYDKIVEDLRDIEKTMFDLGTSPIVIGRGIVILSSASSPKGMGGWWMRTNWQMT